MKRRFLRLALSVLAVAMVSALTLVLERVIAQQTPVAQHNAGILKRDEAALLNALYPKGKERAFAEAAGAYQVNSRRMIDKKWDDDFLGPYNLMLDWYQPGIESHKAGMNLATHSLFAESANRILIAHSGEAAFPKGHLVAGGPGTVVPGAPTRAPIKTGVIVVNRDGKMTEDWAQYHNDLFTFPHAVTECPFDPEKNVWVTDREGAAVFKFSNDGKKLLMTLGESKKPGYDNNHFNMPSDVTCTPDGSIIVSDGYTNSRVVKFDRTGKFVAQVGGKDPGDGRGQFNLIHAVAVDKDGRLYVADRGNHRVQIFDKDLKYVSEIGVHTPCNVHISQDGFLWVSSCMMSRFMKFDLNGRLLYAFGSPLTIGEGGWGNTHNHSVDPDGNVYVSDESRHAIHKLVPKPDADKSRVVGLPYTH